ncbi:hypothetical protein EDC01DRAFT_635307 [Geopyxis carbonaria]|nr:hypothetical protein EDC01DRAFT_635307 [Geopyxis carbonaria]
MPNRASDRGNLYPYPARKPTTTPPRQVEAHEPGGTVAEPVLETTDDELRNLLLKELQKEETQGPKQHDIHANFDTYPTLAEPFEADQSDVVGTFDAQNRDVPSSDVRTDTVRSIDHCMSPERINAPAIQTASDQQEQPADRSLNLNDLVRNIAGTTLWECVICRNHQYKDKNSAKRHVASKHLEGVPCPLQNGTRCGRAGQVFTRSDHLQAHWRVAHSNEPRELFRAALLRLNRGYKSDKSVLKWIDGNDTQRAKGDLPQSKSNATASSRSDQIQPQAQQELHTQPYADRQNTEIEVGQQQVGYCEQYLGSMYETLQNHEQEEGYAEYPGPQDQQYQSQMHPGEYTTEYPEPQDQQYQYQMHPGEYTTAYDESQYQQNQSQVHQGEYTTEYQEPQYQQNQYQMHQGEYTTAYQEPQYQQYQSQVHQGEYDQPYAGVEDVQNNEFHGRFNDHEATPAQSGSNRYGFLTHQHHVHENNAQYQDIFNDQRDLPQLDGPVQPDRS